MISFFKPIIQKQILAWILVFLWMTLIFYFSSRPASESVEVSSRLTEVVVQMIERVALNLLDDLDRESIHFMIRKSAHFLVYFVLGSLVLNAMIKSGIGGLKGVLLTFLIRSTYAVLDEFHQNFIPGRSGELRDILIDTAGATMGILVYLGVNRLKRFIGLA